MTDFGGKAKAGWPSYSRSRRTVKCVGKYSRSFPCGKLFREPALGARVSRGGPGRLTANHLPKTFALIPDFQQAVFRVVPFPTVGTFQITAPRGSLAIVIVRDSESHPAAAGDEKHLEPLVVGGHLQRGVYNPARYGSGGVGYPLLFDCHHRALLATFVSLQDFFAQTE